jgi:hypothetical protein
MAELALIKLTRPETATDPEALISRMDRLERKLGKGAEIAPASVEPKPPSAPRSVESADDELSRAAAPLVSEAEPEEVEDQPAIDVTFESLQKVWPGLFGGLRDLLGARRWAFFREAVPAAVERNTIVLEVAHDFHLSSLEQDDAVAPIVAAKASDLLGTPVKVKFRLKDGSGDRGDDAVDLTQLHDRPDADPAALLESELGAKVVED